MERNREVLRDRSEVMGVSVVMLFWYQGLLEKYPGLLVLGKLVQVPRGRPWCCCLSTFIVDEVVWSRNTRTTTPILGPQVLCK